MTLPENIGRYQIQSELGRGAMGVVYKAVDPNIGRTVALKTMRLDVHGIEEAEMLKRFKHEAVLAGVMNHPNVITIYDAGDHEGIFYMAMEYMEGTTLQVVLHEHKVVSTEQMLNIARQVSAGLDFAHQRGVIHRDIKPANIMLSADGIAKIMDFGIAKSGSNMTTAGQVLGTPTYMSPEQVRGRNLDGRSDLFSFGVCLYEMITGEKPFSGQNITTIIYKIMNEAPIPPRELDVSIHPGISAIITRCLEKNPDERYQTGADLFQDLENYKSYGSSAPTTKVMSAAAAESALPATSSASFVAAQSAHQLESITTAHIAAEDVEEAIAAPSDFAKLVTRTGSTVRRAASTFAAPPARERKKLAAMVMAILVVVVGVAGTVRALRNRTIHSAQAQTQTTPSTSFASPVAGAAQPKYEKPALKPGMAEKTAEDTVKQVTIPPDIGEARITSTPSGARITIGGASQQKWVTPFTATKLQPGKYDVAISKAGYVAQNKELEITGGTLSNLNFALVSSGVTVNVTSQPAGAMVLIDGKPTGKLTPATLTVDQGKHNIEVRKAGFALENTNINLADGEKYRYAPRLIAKNATPQQRAEQRRRRQTFLGKFFGGGQRLPAGKGFVFLRSDPPGATIIHNGKPSLVLTPVRVPMDPGSYTITLHLEGYKNSQRTFNVADGKTTEILVNMEKK